MSKKADIGALEALHNTLAKTLTNAIVDGVKVLTKEGAVETIAAPANILNVARQFLKDNHIESTGGGESPLKGLAESLPFQDEGDNATIQ